MPSRYTWRLARQSYPGIQFIVPIKWALDELHQDCRPKNRMETTVRYNAIPCPQFFALHCTTAHRKSHDTILLM